MPNDKTSLEKAIKLYSFEGVHPAANIVPMMDEDQYQALVEDVRANGFLNPLKVTDENLLIDGRNRICASIDVELDAPVESYNPVDPVQYIVSENVKRRHLSETQRSTVALNIKRYYEQESKEIQLSGLKQYQNKTVRSDMTERKKGERPREKAAKAVGVSTGMVQMADTVEKEAPDLFEKMQKDEVKTTAAYEEVKQRRESKPQPDPAPKPTPKQETVTLYDHLGNQVQYPKTKSKATFNRTNDAVQWARWTWNPVTGCLHGCEYCYAREMANSATFKTAYPTGFDPLLRTDRLDAPANTTFPVNETSPEAKRVFVCSMADLFGAWVPAEWIEKVFSAMGDAPQFEYLLLTKNPKRYRDITIPGNAWIGATVDSNERAAETIEVMRGVDTGAVKWLSLEPLHEPIEANFTGIDWVVIGARSGTNQEGRTIPGFAPKFEWVADIVHQAKKVGCKIYLKANLLGQTSDQWPGMQLLQETPKD